VATPAAEVEIDEALVGALVAAQHPVAADVPVRIVANGWDNVIARLGDDLMVRLPRRAASAALIEHEQRWLPELAPRLPLAVPVPLVCGIPSSDYPWHWTICAWLPGDTAAAAPPTDLAAAADSLGRFIAAMHVPAPADAPENPVRGVALRRRADAVDQRLSSFEGVVDVPVVRGLWDRLSATAAWDGPPIWLHGDLHPSNMLTLDGELSAIIDFGDITAGDPATDLAVAWMLFDIAERDRFRSAIGVDDATWHRAAGWALSLSLAYLTGDDTSSMPDIGRRTLSRVIDEFA
jgi:aminoglycoside phosphotransferase (APT) family kinase protein